MSGKRRGLCVGCIFLVLLGLVGITWLGMSRLKPDVKPDRTFEAKRGDLVVDVVESGTIEAVSWVDVRPRTGGRVSSLLVKEGELVQAGQALALVDPKETQLLVDQFQAQHRSARSRVSQSRTQYLADDASAIAGLRQAEAQWREAKQEFDAQPRITDTAIEQAHAAYDNAAAARKLLIEATLPSETVEADNRVAESEAAHTQARAEHERVKGLVTKGFASQRDLDAAEAQLATSNSHLAAARRAKQLVESQKRTRINATDEQVRQAKATWDQATANGYIKQAKKDALDAAAASLEAAKAHRTAVRASYENIAQASAGADQIGSQLADAMRQLHETEIRSPLRGMVTKRYVQVGDLVTALSGFSAGTPVFQVADLGQLKVKLMINEVDEGRLKIGQPVEVSVDAVRGEAFKGTVGKIASASEAQAASSTGISSSATAESVVKFQVEVLLNKPDPRLKPGMSAKCRIITNRATNAVLLAAEAIGKEIPKDPNSLASKDKYFALKLLPGKQTWDAKTSKLVSPTKRVALTVGLRGPTEYEILSGAQPGDKFVKAPYGGPKRKEIEMFKAGGGDEQ